jgi:hypothetical protein
MDKELVKTLEDLHIQDPLKRSPNLLRLELECLLDSSEDNLFGSLGLSEVENDLIITGEENNTHHKIVKAYSLFMEYYNEYLMYKENENTN